MAHSWEIPKAVARASLMAKKMEHSTAQTMAHWMDPKKAAKWVIQWAVEKDGQMAHSWEIPMAVLMGSWKVD